MPQDDRDKLNRIEELKGRLFSKNYQTKIEHRDSFTHPKEKEVQSVWADGEQSPFKLSYSPDKFLMKTSMFKKFFIYSLVFFGIAILYASYVFFAGSNTVSNDNIDISILGNNFAAGGEELSLIVGIANRNNSALDLVDLVVEYPKSSANGLLDPSQGVERLRQSLGTIPAGAVRNENLKLVLFGEQGSVRPIKISLEYRVEGSNSIFVKDKSYDVTLSSAPINLSVDAPTSISPNQDITLKVKVSLNAAKVASKILLKMDYPAGFKFISAIPPPTFSNNVWNLGDLAPLSEHDISIVGKMIDVFDGEQKSFRISTGSQLNGDKSAIDVVFNSLLHNIAIKKPFIDVKLLVNGSATREASSDSKSAVNVEIQWKNNLDTKINDLSIQAKILGNAVNRKTINAEQGFYNSSVDTITWDKNYKNEFSEVSPGASGSVKFSFSPASLFSATGGFVVDPSANIEVSISGKQLVQGYATEDLKNSEFSVVHIISDLGFNTKALYYSGPFTNKGPIPPKVESETTYTIEWSLTNTTNNLSKGVVRSTLPSWVRFVGTVSPAEENLTYNASTRELVWNIGFIPKGTGITAKEKKVSFQVALTPSLSQLGTIPVLVNTLVLTAHDDFANVDKRVNKGSIYTQLESEASFPSTPGTVVE